MNYHDITKADMVNGDGLRVVLWVSGCSHHCKECHNPITWNENSGIKFDDAAKKEIFDQLDKEEISGITFSGGDPLYENNRSEVEAFIKEIHAKYPNKTIWLYTGYTLEEIAELEILQYIDVLVDGEFKNELKDSTLCWKGSSNQRVIDVQPTIISPYFPKEIESAINIHCPDHKVFM